MNHQAKLTEIAARKQQTAEKLAALYVQQNVEPVREDALISQHFKPTNPANPAPAYNHKQPTLTWSELLGALVPYITLFLYLVLFAFATGFWFKVYLSWITLNPWGLPSFVMYAIAIFLNLKAQLFLFVWLFFIKIPKCIK